MSNLSNLLKIDIINTIGINRLISSDKKKKINALIMISLIIFSIIVLIISVFKICFDISDMLIQINQMDLLLVMGFMGSIVFSIFTSIYKAPSYLYSSKDIELLGSLPIKDSTILTSKLILLVLSNYIYSSLVMIIPAIVYFIKAKTSFIFIINLIIMFMLTPLIPIVLATIITYFVGMLSSKSRYKNCILIGGSIVIVVVIMILSFNMESLLYNLISKSETIIDLCKKIYPLVYYFVDGLKNNNIISVIIFTIISILPFTIFVILFSKGFRKINSKMNENYKVEYYDLKELKTNSILKSLVNKEIKRYFSSYSYVLNTSFGVVLLSIFAISTVFISQDKLTQILQLSSSTDILNIQLTLMIIFCVLMSCTTNSSISLEGKNFWILKSSPIEIIDIFKSKILMNVLLVLPISLLSFFIISIKLNFNFKYIIIMNILIILCTILTSLYGLYINLMFPKLDFVNDIEIVKRSASSMISIFSIMGYIAINIGIYYILKIQEFNNFLIILIFITTGINLILLKLLKIKGITMFNKI